MNKILFTAALLSLSVIMPAHAKSDLTTFEYQGVTYKYTVTTLSDTKRVIAGYATPGASFRLVVSGKNISGNTNGMPVQFTMSDVKPYVSGSKGSVTVASR